jgi:uncharacterized protein (DUF488 family)
MTRVVTIGAYGRTGEDFLRALRGAGVATLVDIRRRRGMRGSQYAWANSQRLQAALAGAGIGYVHVRELAPSEEIRDLQRRADAAARIGPRSRPALAPEFAAAYSERVLDRADLDALLPAAGVFALFCVESAPEACHRSLVAQRLARAGGVKVLHL